MRMLPLPAQLGIRTSLPRSMNRIVHLKFNNFNAYQVFKFKYATPCPCTIDNDRHWTMVENEQWWTMDIGGQWTMVDNRQCWTLDNNGQ